MDNRRMNTEQVLFSGGFGLIPPPSKVPPNFVGQIVEEWEWTQDQLRAGLESGGLDAYMYYGCWHIWRTEENRYSGQLMQYRLVTEEFHGLSLEDALAEAIDWGTACQG